MARVQFRQQAKLLLGFGLRGQGFQVLSHALVQNAAEVSQVHESLREQVAAVTLDELLQTSPTLGIADRLQHREPHAVAVHQPAAQQHFDHLLQAVDQLAVGPARGRLLAALPVGRGNRQALRDRLAADARTRGRTR